MKKLTSLLAIVLVLDMVLMSNRVDAAGVPDTHPSNAIYKQINVPDQDLNTTGTPILYRYSISAPPKDPSVIADESIMISRTGVSFEPITMKIYSDANFKKLIQEQAVKGKVKNSSTETLVFKLSPRLTIKAGQTIYIQIETKAGGNKDTAYITTGHKGLDDVTIKAKPIKIPSITITDPLGNQGIHVNVGDTFTLSGTPKNLKGLKYWTGKGSPTGNYYNNAWFFDPMFNNSCTNNESSAEGVWTITCKAKNAGVGKIYVEIYRNGNVYRSNTVEVTVGPSYPQGTIKVITPNGGENFTSGSNVTIDVKTNLTEKQAEGINLQLYKYVEGKDYPYMYVQTIESLWTKGFPYQWKVPVVESGKYVIYASAIPTFPSKDIIDFSDKPFTIANTSTDSCSFTRDLTLGSSGSDVVNLQNFLETRGFLSLPTGVAKGYFGSETKVALVKYQSSIGISPADGYFGVMTRAKVKTECGVSVNAQPSVQITSIKAWSIPKISPVDGSQIPSGAQYSYNFKVTSLDKDIYIPIKAARFDIAGGVSYEVIDSTTGERFSSGFNQTTSLSSNAPKVLGDNSSVYDNKGYYLVKEGTTQDFTLNIILSNVEKRGEYSTRIFALTYLETANAQDKHNEIWFDKTNKDTESDTIFIQVNSTTSPSIKVLSPNGGENYKVGDDIVVNWVSKGSVGQKVDLQFDYRINGSASGGGYSVVTSDTGVYTWKGFDDRSAASKGFNGYATYSLRICVLADEVDEEHIVTCDSSDNSFTVISNLATSTTPIINSIRQPRPRVVVPATSSSNTSIFSSTDLEIGMAHPDVISLQKYLNSNGYMINTVQGEDGSLGYETNYFGEKTKQALMKFQKDKGIYPVWGFFGPQTRRAMGI